jgi:hypothetical protein
VLGGTFFLVKKRCQNLQKIFLCHQIWLYVSLPLKWYFNQVIICDEVIAN